MLRKSKENLLVLKLEHPLYEESLVKYIDFPSDYILRKRLALNEDEVATIRQAYGYFQDTVREVLHRIRCARYCRRGWIVCVAGGPCAGRTVLNCN